MDDWTAHYFTSVGRLCADASVARLHVRLRLHDGRELVGVPRPPRDSEGGQELDDTGLADEIELVGVTVALSAIVEATLVHPELRRG